MKLNRKKPRIGSAQRLANTFARRPEVETTSDLPPIVRKMVETYGFVFGPAAWAAAFVKFPKNEMDFIEAGVEKLPGGRFSIEKLAAKLVDVVERSTPDLDQEPEEQPVRGDLYVNNEAPPTAMATRPEAIKAQSNAGRVFDLRGMKVIQEYAEQSLVPNKDKMFEGFGVHSDLSKILASKSVYLPIYIYGDTGYGKTKMVEQACAEFGRELIEVPCTEQTTEEDLIGKYRLLDGTMIWEDGPVLLAMKRGAVLLLDEVDYVSARATAELQMVLRFKKYYVKKTGEMVTAQPGFMVVATGNTSGRGDDNGEFFGTMPLNRAFRERFRAIIKHIAPTALQEKKILMHHCKDETIVERLTFWADATRKTRANDGARFEISTARLISICEMFQVFPVDRAVEAAISNMYSKEFEDAALSIWKRLNTEH